MLKFGNKQNVTLGLNMFPMKGNGSRDRRRNIWKKHRSVKYLVHQQQLISLKS